jgi:hypothetical protein
MYREDETTEIFNNAKSGVNPTERAKKMAPPMKVPTHSGKWPIIDVSFEKWNNKLSFKTL